MIQETNVMCELFGFSGTQPEQLNQPLREFFSHSNQHPHGWGLALLHGTEAAIEKEPLQASKSLYLKERLREPIFATTLLAHIRYATIGNTEWRNCHPYTQVDRTGRRWTLIHNGTIFEFTPMNHYVTIQNGDTDSERILLYLIDQVNARTVKLGHPLTAEERFALLDEIVVAVSPGNKLNLLIYDGELLYAHTNYANSLYRRETNTGVYITTQPLTMGQWEPVPFTTLLAYQGNQLLFTGTNHGQEYFVDEEKMKLLYLAFAEL
jgi:glutamine amidotransferase